MDGNCWIASVAAGTEFNWRELKGKLMSYISEHKSIFMTLSSDCGGEKDLCKFTSELAKNGTWGGIREFRILMIMLKRPIEVYTPSPKNQNMLRLMCSLEVFGGAENEDLYNALIPQKLESIKVIFNGRNHYEFVAGIRGSRRSSAFFNILHRERKPKIYSDYVIPNKD